MLSKPGSILGSPHTSPARQQQQTRGRGDRLADGLLGAFTPFWLVAAGLAAPSASYCAV